MKKQLTPATIAFTCMCLISLACSTYLSVQSHHQPLSMDMDHEQMIQQDDILPDIGIIDVVVRRLANQIGSACQRP